MHECGHPTILVGMGRQSQRTRTHVLEELSYLVFGYALSKQTTKPRRVVRVLVCGHVIKADRVPLVT
ncbi:MAG TPA: hypothetical protein VGH78_02590 [Solirubrobacteraceae bacterium]